MVGVDVEGLLSLNVVGAFVDRFLDGESFLFDCWPVELGAFECAAEEREWLVLLIDG